MQTPRCLADPDRPTVAIRLYVDEPEDPAGGREASRIASRSAERVSTLWRVYGHLFAQDRASMLDAMNQPVSRLCVYGSQEPMATVDGHAVA